MESCKRITLTLTPCVTERQLGQPTTAIPKVDFRHWNHGFRGIIAWAPNGRTVVSNLAQTRDHSVAVYALEWSRAKVGH